MAKPDYDRRKVTWHKFPNVRPPRDGMYWVIYRGCKMKPLDYNRVDNAFYLQYVFQRLVYWKWYKTVVYWAHIKTKEIPRLKEDYPYYPDELIPVMVKRKLTEEQTK